VRSLTPSRTAANRYLRSPLGVREVKQNGSGTDCLTVRRWHRCDLNTDLLRCVNQPTDVWVCDWDITSPDVIKLKYLNACYTPTDDVIDTTTLSPSATFLPPGTFGTLNAECDDVQCTVCDLFYKATLCPRQANPPSYELYVRISDVESCGSFCYGGFGWYVRQGPTFTLAQIAEAGGVVCPDGDCATYQASPKDCCSLPCIPNCGKTYAGNLQDCGLGEIPNSNLECCCSQDYSFSINWNLLAELHVTDDLIVPPPAYASHQRITSQASVAGSVEGGVVSWSGQPAGATPTYEVVQQNYSVPPQPFDSTFTYEHDHAPPGNCIPEVFIPAEVAGFVYCPAGGPWTTPHTGTDGYTEVLSTSTERDCFSIKFTYSAQRWEPGSQTGQRWTITYWVDIRIGPLGLCGGGCPGGASSGGGSGRGAVLAALGQRIWPVLVAPVAFLEFEE